MLVAVNSVIKRNITDITDTANRVYDAEGFYYYRYFAK
jgi:hypothetical protein